MSDQKIISKVLVYFQSNQELNTRIQDMAASLGWKRTGSRPDYNLLFFGYGPKEVREKVILHDLARDPMSYAQSYLGRGEGWILINADTEWEKIEALFGPAEPEFDETPLPYDMTPELQSETMDKFNLSQEQWDLMPLMVREALAGCEVKQAELDYKWHPIDEPERGTRTVLFTRNAGDGNNAMNDNAIGYFTPMTDGRFEIRIRVGRLAPEHVTHWCYLPGKAGAEEAGDE